MGGGEGCQLKYIGNIVAGLRLNSNTPISSGSVIESKSTCVSQTMDSFPLTGSH